MPKNPLCALVILSLVGCASPKVGERNHLDDPVALKTNSSDALHLAADVGFTGLRDLSVDEFDDHNADVEKQAALASSVVPSGTAAAVTAGAGLAAGLSLKSLTGIGLLGALARDSRPDNYDFADDFDSRYRIERSNDSEAFLAAIDRSLSLFVTEVAEVYSVTPEWRESLNDRSTEQVMVFSGSRGTKVAIDGRPVTFLAIVMVECLVSDSVCNAYFTFKVLAKNNPLRSRLVTLFSREIGPAPLYVPPDREIYQLPAILQNGEMTYLVEK